MCSRLVEENFFDRPYFLSSLLLQICLYIMGAENLNVCSLMEICFQNKIVFFLVPGMSMCLMLLSKLFGDEQNFTNNSLFCFWLVFRV